ncbi:hypothetical protein KY359_01750 [Candidatus Woesearchaeota archaeon]|nr:hypothetical protein [Candidatus Woesearchaeota archaeon]
MFSVLVLAMFLIGCDEQAGKAFGIIPYQPRVVAPSVDTTPPGPVTGLRETSVGCDRVTWVWTNPTDTDFDRIEVRIGSSAQSLSRMTTSFTKDGLASNTKYVIFVTTLDKKGNKNTRSDAALTADCTPPPEPAPSCAYSNRLFCINATHYGNETIYADCRVVNASFNCRYGCNAARGECN